MSSMLKVAQHLFRTPIFLLLSAGFILAADSVALRDAKLVLEKLAQQHREAKSFSLKFESRAVGADGEFLPGNKGSLVSADSGRFRLEHAQGVVVCDGKTLWQYVPENKQVLLRDASDAGSAGGVLLRFLQAKPLRAVRQGAGLLRVVLDPASVGENLDSLILTIDDVKSVVREVDSQDPAGNRVLYAVKSLRYDENPRPGLFVFKAPKGVEIVDMR